MNALEAGLEGTRKQREQSAAKYRPRVVEMLIVAEAPPGDASRYFYFESVRDHDAMFRHVARAVLGQEPTRLNKSDLLGRLRDKGVFLIDLSVDPVAPRPKLNAFVDGLIERVRELEPRHIVLVKVGVYDAAFAALRDAGQPVFDERIPFPDSGQQLRFREAFSRVLTAMGWSST